MTNEKNMGMDGGQHGTVTIERWVSCEIPGCANRMPYAERGRRRSTAVRRWMVCGIPG